jgi:hypothetical protein
MARVVFRKSRSMMRLALCWKKAMFASKADYVRKLLHLPGLQEVAVCYQLLDLIGGRKERDRSAGGGDDLR